MKKTEGGNPFPFLLLPPAIAFFLFLFPFPVQADDLLATSDISRVTAIDTDGDGLTNAKEAEIGTNPGLFDTDSDGYGDGIESLSQGIANPLNPLMPDLGAVSMMRDFVSIQNITSGSTRNAFSSTWLLDGRVAYMEADENFANGSIFVKDLYEMSVPRREIASGLSAELREITADPLGKYVFFHKTDTNGKQAIFKANVNTGEVSKAIPQPGSFLSYNMRNPSVGAPLSVDIANATLTIDPTGVGLWAVVETDLPSAALGQLYGFQLSTDPATYGEWTGLRRQVTNTSNYGMQIITEKISHDLSKIMYQEYEFIEDIFRDYLGYSSSTLIPIILGSKQPYVWVDNRLEVAGRVPFFFPIGFDKLTVYLSRDTNNIYSFNDPLNFSSSDFDIIVRGPPYNHITLPGNQVLGSISPEGGRIMFMDDYLSDGVPGGNFNLYVASLSSMTRIADGMLNDKLEGFVTPGSVFEGNAQNFVLKVPSGTDPYVAQQMFAYSPLKPVSDAAEASSAITSKVVYGPEGLYSLLRYGLGTPGFYQTFSWTPQELLVRNADGTTSLMDETQITMGWGVVSGASVTYESLPEQYILERDLVNRKIRFIAPHFSEYGLIAPKILKQPSGVDHWPLQD